MYSHVNKDIRFDEEIEIDKKKNNSNKTNKNNGIVDQSSDTDIDINSPLNSKFVLKKSANPLLTLSDNNNFTVDDETQKMDEAFSSVDSKCDLLLNSNIVNIDVDIPGVTIDQIEKEPNINIITTEIEIKIKKEENVVENQATKEEENVEKEENVENKPPEESQFFGFKPFE
jgi:hypothetical protein